MLEGSDCAATWTRGLSQSPPAVTVTKAAIRKCRRRMPNSLTTAATAWAKVLAGATVLVTKRLRGRAAVSLIGLSGSFVTLTRDDDLRQHPGHHRTHADGTHQPDYERHRQGGGPGESRDLQPGQLDQGSHR